MQYGASESIAYQKIMNEFDLEKKYIKLNFVLRKNQNVLDIFKNENTSKFNNFIKYIEVKFIHANLSFHGGGEDPTGKSLKKMLENLQNL